MKSHEIVLDDPRRILVVTEPDWEGHEAYWHFAIQDGVHRSQPHVYSRFSNKRYFEPPNERLKGWEDTLTGQLRSPLYSWVSSNFLDTEWASNIFPQVEKIIKDYNSGPVDAE